MPTKKYPKSRDRRHKHRVSLIKTEVTKKRHNASKWNPDRQTLHRFILVLLSLCVLLIAILYQDLQSRVVDLTASLIELLLALNLGEEA